MRLKSGKETAEQRWSRWDGFLSQSKFVEVVTEFDRCFKAKEHLLIGDLVRRDQALDALGVISFSKEKAKKEENKRGFRRGKF
jgi:hypothetical protein